MQEKSFDKLQTVQNKIDMVCYHSFEQVESLRERWDEFVARVGADLYSSFDWCETWWKHFGQGRQLKIYIASVEGRMVGVLPLFLERLRWGPFGLRVVRFVGCDHLTTLVNIAVDADWIVPVADTLLSQLNHNGAWDVIHIGELAGYCETAGAFANALSSCDEVGEVIFGRNDYPHLVFNISGGFEEYLATLSQKERHNVRRDERYFSVKSNVVYCQPKSQEDFEKAMDRLIELHTEHWNHRGRLGHFVEWPGVAAFHREIGGKLLKSGRLVLVEIYRDGKLSISEYGGIFGSRMHWIINARAPGVVSTRVGFCAVLRLAVAAGLKQIDSLAGTYDYKRRLGAVTLGIKNISVKNRRICSRLRFQLLRTIVWFVGLVYFRLWFWHLAPWIRRKWPNLRIGWLKEGMWVRFIRSHFLMVSRIRCSVGSGDGGEALPAADADVN